VHGWRVKSAHFVGHDCALVESIFYPISKDKDSHEFVDFRHPMNFPAPALGNVVEDKYIGIEEVGSYESSR